MAEDGSLEDARDWLRDRLDKGAHCPCCTQYAKVYRRKLNQTMVRTLAGLFQAGGTHEFVHGPTVLKRQAGPAREIGKLALFGLVMEETERREDGGRSGWWFVTRDGESFLRGEIKKPKYARVYDGRLLGYAGDAIDVHEVAPEFRFDDLMDGK